MRTSVVVCTYNRADGLRDTLDSLRHQRFSDFEVVVVNGPSTDHTEQVLADHADRVKIERNPLANLSVSRNLGIRASAGDVVAFIDDDALPEFDWLHEALPAFADPEVAGVGGIVFDHTGMALQYRYSAANRFGETQDRDDMPYDELSVPGSFLVPYLQGTNALFRRDALARIGLFDETFDYYLDETDVCIRLVDAGFVLRQLPDAPVHHKFLPSHVRNEERVVTNWFPIVKNHTYFGYRHALDHGTEIQVIEKAAAFARNFVVDVTQHEVGGRVPPGTGAKCEGIVGDALADGIVLGRERSGLRLPRVSLDPPPFLPYPTVDASRRRRYVLVSSGYPPAVTGGIARYTGEAAPAIAARGHEVRVITRSEAGSTVDLEDGVWVHRLDTRREYPGAVAEAPPAVDHFASAVVDELERMSAWTMPDLVYGPAWDVEVLGVSRCVPVPVALFLATPLDIVAEHSAMLENPDAAPTIRSLLALEREMFRAADLAHADSRAVLGTIADRYGDLIDPARAGVALLGLRDRPPYAPPAEHARKFLFVGRLEARKGIDTLLEAIAVIAPDHRDVELVVIGADGVPPDGGDLSFTERFAAQHEGEDVLSQVTFTGRVDDEELERWHEWADCLVLPSRYESFGLTMLQGMLSNRAVISCDVGAIPEVVRDTIDGLLTPPGDVEALVAAMLRVIDEPGLARSLAASGRARFESDFAIDRSVDALLAQFARVGIERVDSREDGDEGGDGDREGVRSVRIRGFPGLELDTGARLVVDAGADAPVRDVLVIAPTGAEVTITSPDLGSQDVSVDDRMTRIPVGPAGPATVEVRAGRAVVCGTVRVEPEATTCG